MKLHSFKTLISTMLISLSLSFINTASAAYPAGDVEIIVPVTPGSATDLLARLIAKHLSSRLEHNFVVLNKPGAASQIGASHVKRAKPDGQTLLVIHSGIMANSFIYKSFSLDMIQDFTYIAGISETPWVLATNSEMPISSVEDLISYGKANPGKLNVGTTGGSSEIDMRNFLNKASIDAELILYPGGSDVLLALAKNEIQLALNAIRGIETVADKGVKALAVTSSKRFPLATNVPSINESMPGIKASTLWFGLLGPANMSDEITNQLNKEISEILNLPEIRKQLNGMAHEPMEGSATSFLDFATNQINYFEKAAQEAKIQPK